jgi:hypothetical protein
MGNVTQNSLELKWVKGQSTQRRAVNEESVGQVVKGEAFNWLRAGGKR